MKGVKEAFIDAGEISQMLVCGYVIGKWNRKSGVCGSDKRRRICVSGK